MKILWQLLPPVAKVIAAAMIFLTSLGFGTALFLVTTVRSEVAQAKSDLRAEIATARAQDMTHLRTEIAAIKKTQDKMLGILLSRK